MLCKFTEMKDLDPRDCFQVCINEKGVNNIPRQKLRRLSSFGRKKASVFMYLKKIVSDFD